MITVLRDRESHDLLAVDRDPAAARIDLEEVAHAIDPPLGSLLRSRFGLGLADPSITPITVEEYRVRSAFSAG
ncbi:hypothetical protein GCM10023319_71310 [Nocardia iowensis]